MANEPGNRSATAGESVQDAPAANQTSAARTAAARRLLPAGEGLPGLDRLAGLAARLLHAPSSQVALLTDVQTIAAGTGASRTGHTDPLVNSLCLVAAESGTALVVADARSDVRVAALPPVTSGDIGSYLGVPMVADDGNTVGALCVFGPSPRSWSPDDVAVLTQLAASAVAELELSALSGEYEAGRALWELAIEAGEIGTFDWDLLSGVLSWDDRLIELFGYDRLTFTASIEAFNARLHPDDLPRVTDALQGAIDSCGAYAAEYRIVLPDGTTRWVAARGRALAGDGGRAVRLLGAAYDTTASRAADARVARVLESMTAAFFLIGRDWRFGYVNGHAERLLGRTREELLGADLWELFPHAQGSDFETHYRAAMDGGIPTSFEAYYPEPLDAWYEVQAWPDPDGLSVYFVDITARRSAQLAAEQAAARAELLAEVTAELTDTLQADVAVSRLADLVVPALADWCVVTLVDDEERAGSAYGLRDVGWAHTDPSLRATVARYCESRLRALTEESFVMQALRTGRPARVHAGAAARIRDVLGDQEARELITELAPDSVVVLPLRGRGRTVGLLSLFRGPDRADMSAADLSTAAEVAGRAGLALDNSRLYRQQLRLAEELQRSMLTEPPEPDHAQVIVRYVPATEAAQVGGDWYDAFLQPDGATVLVIGDVVGHDTAAAAAMGQVRTLVRAIAADTGEGPAGVLTRVDRVLRTLQVETTATAVVARLEQTPDERSRGITRVRWSNAGHPPPMVIHPDATVAPLLGVEADLLLGIDPSSRRVESEATLDRGATVLLYTDGLVERRGQSLDDGLAALRDTLADLAAQSVTLDELCDATLARMLPERPDDDVALVAVRLHPQHLPRPAEAGPNRVPDNVPSEPAVDPSAG